MKNFSLGNSVFCSCHSHKIFYKLKVEKESQIWFFFIHFCKENECVVEKGIALLPSKQLNLFQFKCSILKIISGK